MSGQPKLRPYASANARLNAENNYTKMAEKPPDPKAAERFRRSPYQMERYDVAGYLAKKYNIKGEMRSEQENFGEVQTK